MDKIISAKEAERLHKSGIRVQFESQCRIEWWDCGNSCMWMPGFKYRVHPNEVANTSDPYYALKEAVKQGKQIELLFHGEWNLLIVGPFWTHIPQHYRIKGDTVTPVKCECSVKLDKAKEVVDIWHKKYLALESVQADSMRVIESLTAQVNALRDQQPVLAWRCASNVAGRITSNYTKDRAQMLIYRDKGYVCTPLKDD